MNQRSTSPFKILSTDNQFDLPHGFLPSADPIEQLPEEFSEWETLALDLPKLLTSDQTRNTISNMPEFNVSQLTNANELERAMVILSYLGHAYIWNNAKPVNTLPKVLAKPWHAVASKIGRPPVLSYGSYALYNWKRLDENKNSELGNIVLLQNFLGGIDEEWFILIHVDIETKAAPAVAALQPALQAAKERNTDAVLQHFNTMIKALALMCETLERMPEHCDPYIYYSRVRPYIHGWKDNPALPDGVIYEGVDEYKNEPQFFKGETGAQSTIIPALDAALGITHENNPLKAHLNEMRTYMPPEHREFLNALELGPSLRDYALENHTTEPKLRDCYNECIQLIDKFRKTHLAYAASYIQKQHQTSLSNPTAVGTGGTPFMDYLRKHETETKQHLI